MEKGPREDHQEERAGDLVDGGGGEVHLAQGGSEGPFSQSHRCYQEWNTNKKAFVCHREMKDVGVGDGVHLGEPEHHVDDEGVAHQAADADDGIEDLYDGHHIGGHTRALRSLRTYRLQLRHVRQLRAVTNTKVKILPKVFLFSNAELS